MELLTSGKDGADLPGFRLALIHHRFADLADGDRARRLLADRVDLVLHGHQHEAAVEPWASPDHDLLVLAAGCLYEGDEHHRYPNACQMIDLELDDKGRPTGARIRFRGWAERNGLFWGDDDLLYRKARHGRLVLGRRGRGWYLNEAGGTSTPSWHPVASGVFVGRRDELAAIGRAIMARPGARVAVVAVQGMVGVGKSFRRFLLEVNGGRTARSHRVFAVQRRAGRQRDEAVLNSLFSLDDSDSSRDLATAQKPCNPDAALPDGLLAIGYDGMGGRIVLSLVGPHRGEVWYLDTGDPRPTEANPRVEWFDRRDVWKIAGSFAEFMASLRPLDDGLGASGAP